MTLKTTRRFGSLIFVVFFSTVFFFAVSPAFAAEPPRSVSVSGQCIRSVIPDRGAVTLTVEAKDADSKRAQAAATRIYESIRTKIAALRLPNAELSTDEYTSEEIREWEKEKRVSKGFRTRISLRVSTSEHARISEVIDVGSREGVKQMSALRLYVSPQKMLEEKTLCLKEAAEQARTKADSLARALGAKLGEVLSIEENARGDSPSPIRYEAMAMDSTARKAAPTIEPGKVELLTNVQVSFLLK